MASASAQLNAVSHNRFTALATEDMDFCAGGNDTTTTDTINDQEELRSTGRTAVVVRGNDLHPSDIAGWKISGKQLKDPNAPTRNGTSSQRYTNPDLAFISKASAPRGVTWRNTGETLGSDHCILEITIPITESTQRAQQQQIVDWHEYRKKLEENVTETMENIEAWTNMLNATTIDATQTVEAEPEATMLDSRLAHLMEARNSLRRRWKRQRHNRKLRKRIAQLNRDIEHHSAVLCREQWHATTKGAQHYMLNKTIHKAVKEMEEAEVQRCLDAKYLPVTPTDPLPSYKGATNERLHADIEEWEVRAVLQTINCKSASGPDYVTNKALRNLNDTAIEALTKYYNQCWQTGKLPQQWKTAKMVLIPKPGKSPSIDNLRSISLTSCMGKVLEHVLLNRWQRYMVESNIYPHTMLGFRAKLCTQDAMLLLKNEIVGRHFPTLDNRAVLGLDLQGAFDNVHHSAGLRQVSHLNLG
ncbi:uncharacterized protein LOC142775538 [Rhipicephalus microplus]|uniref:uncharacterized protein LOC142775538 n=1 Tax=Rhipicephalus microplus TaxID=6941 RepID=UPI003F6A54D0